VQIWSQRFDAKMGELFALQDDLTAAVMEKLTRELGERLPRLHAEREIPDTHAYNLYLQARSAFSQETPAGFSKALRLYQSATEADKSFAPAWAGIAETHLRLEWYGMAKVSDALPAVRTALDTALRLDPDSISALCSLAITQACWEWNWMGGGETFQRALTAGRGVASVPFHYALDYLTPRGRLDEALPMLRRAAELDPISPIVNTAIGGCYYRMRRFEEAADTLYRTLQGNPEFGHAHWSLGRVLLEQGSLDEALRRFEWAASIMGNIPAAVAELGYCHARMQNSELARRALQELERRSATEWVSPLHLALIYAGLGDADAVQRCLESALHTRIRQLVWVNVDPRYDRVRHHPAFARVIAQLGL
jgi:tetratricopeptide (TPR) repeat protein